MTNETCAGGLNARTDEDAPTDKKPDAEESPRWDPTEPVDHDEFVPLDMANNIEDDRTKQRVTWVDGFGRAYADSMAPKEIATDGGSELFSESLKSALKHSSCHPDVVRYAELAAERGGTPILNSFRHFHSETDVSRIADIGTQIEQTLWHHGARPTLDRHGHVDQTNTEILEAILDEKGERVVTDGGQNLPRFEYNETGISTGDVVVDLASGKSLQVVGKSTQPVGEHPKTRSDETAALFGADADETVFNCVFLPDGERVSAPTKTYAYPASRLLRYPVENATDYDGTMQTWLRTAFLNELADGVNRSGNDGLATDLEALLRDVYSDDIGGIFAELVETEQLMTDGGYQLADGESHDGNGGVRPVSPHVGPATSDGGSRRFPEMSGFRRDILLTLARSEPTHGRGLNEDLESLRDEDLGDSRLYPNLNELVDAGLIEKREHEHDQRSHEYILTPAGRASLREHAQRVQGAVDALDHGNGGGR